MMTLPSWLAGPLVTLGLVFLIAKPLGLADEWAFYFYWLVLAAAAGVFFGLRYQVTVVERTEESVLMRCGRRRSMPRDTHMLDDPQ